MTNLKLILSLLVVFQFAFVPIASANKASLVSQLIKESTITKYAWKEAKLNTHQVFTEKGKSFRKLSKAEQDKVHRNVYNAIVKQLQKEYMTYFTEAELKQLIKMNKDPLQKKLFQFWFFDTKNYDAMWTAILKEVNKRFIILLKKEKTAPLQRGDVATRLRGLKYVV